MTNDRVRAVHTWLALSATPLGLLVASALSQHLYVDESALLTGMAVPKHSREQRPVHRSEETVSANERLFVELLDAGAAPERIDVHAGPTCNCSALTMTMRARGDGSEALLLSVGGAKVPGDDNGLAANLVIDLAALLGCSPWLAKDVLLLLLPGCACARPRPREAANRHSTPARAPLARFLAAYHQLSALRHSAWAASMYGDETRAELRLRQSGVLRQKIAISLEHDRRHGGDADGGDVRQAAAVAVALAGVNGRLPNLDTYGIIWKLAGIHSLSMPLLLSSASPARGGLGAADVSTGGGALGVAEALRRTDMKARGAANFIADLAWGVPVGDHATALAIGIDAVSLRAPASDRVGPRKSTGYSDVLGLLEGMVRSVSNLGEALHHSHDLYVLADAQTFLPLKLTTALLHAPPVFALLLRAWTHAGGCGECCDDPGRGSCGSGRSVFAWLVAAPHALMAHLIVLIIWPLAVAAPVVVHVSLLYAVWAVLCAGVYRTLACRTPGFASDSSLSAHMIVTAATLFAVLGSFGYTCLSPPLGILGSGGLALVAAVGLPPPARSPTRFWPGSAPRDAASAVACSPYGLMLAVAIADRAAPHNVLAAAAEAHVDHGALLFPFVWLFGLPLSAVVGGVRVARMR